MRALPIVAAAAGLVLVSTASAQIRTPIATEPVMVTQPGPAPYNAKAVVTSPTSATVSWDAAAGARGYVVDRKRFDGLIAASGTSGIITTPSWTDGGLEAGQDYLYTITALYFDGRQGKTDVVASTPMPGLPVVRSIKNVDMASTEGVLRLTPCGQKNSGGPGPASVYVRPSPPSGAILTWAPVAGTDVNYVIDRAVEGTTSWTLVGSTCGGPSPVRVSSDYITVRDLAGGVVQGTRYVYRVYAIASNGAAGWNTYHFQPPCATTPKPQATVSGSTVTVKWSGNEYNTCSGDVIVPPDSYTLTSSFGFTKTSTSGWVTETIYGVPLGTHTFTLVANYRPGFTTPPATASATVAY